MRDDENPWVERLQSLNKDRIRELARQSPKPLELTERRSPASLEKALNAHLESFYFVSDAILAVLELLCDRAIDACKDKYSDVRSYKRQMGGTISQSDASSVTCITGLAGCGKTELTKALSRVFGKPVALPLEEFFVEQPVISPFRGISLPEETTVKQTYALLCPGVFKGSPPSDKKILVECMSRCLYGDGVLHISLDEIQGVSMSAEANVRVSQILLAVRRLGVNFSFNTNFDMARRLIRRPQQECDRLLREIVCLRPYVAGTKDWVAYLQDVQAALGEMCGFNIVAEQEWLHRHTQGVLRSVKTLFARGGYLMAAQGESKLLKQHLAAAYRSDELVVFRSDNEAIFKQTVSRAPGKGRKDLWCPFEDHFNFVDSTVPSAQASFEMGKKIAVQSTTAMEHAGYKALAAAVQKTDSGQSGNVVPMSRARSNSRNSLIEDTMSFLRARAGADTVPSNKDGAE